MNDPIRLALPETGKPELEILKEVLESGFLSQGPKVRDFETVTAQEVGVAHAVATSSATTALHLAMAVLDIGPGDEVILPSFTFPATCNVIIQQGGVPVLADIDLKTLNLDPDDVAHRITKKTRAIMPVHLFGNPMAMEPLRQIAHSADLFIVEDAACALGSRYQGKACGGLGDMGCFSYHGRKIITTGEGGMLTTDNPQMMARAQRLRQHGGERTNNRFEFMEPGYNYRMSDLHAAVGLAQMGRLQTIIDHRRTIAKEYDRLLATVSQVTPPTVTPGGEHNYQTYCLILDESVDRDQVIRWMGENGVECAIGTYAVHTLEFMQKRTRYGEGDFPQSWQAWRQGLALPMHQKVGVEEATRVVELLQKAIKMTTPTSPSPPSRSEKSTASQKTPSFRVHPTALVEEGAKIAPGAAIWHHCHIRSGCEIGAGTSIGKNGYVDPGVVIGEQCKIQNNVSLYRGLTVGNEVFIGPVAILTNDLYARASHWDDKRLRHTRLEDGCSIGAGAVIVCGTTIGRYATVGAGAVVTSDIEPFNLYYGTPARKRGYVCICGLKLAIPESEPAGEYRCGECKRGFRLDVRGMLEPL
jgi:perosamine synthetase